MYVDYIIVGQGISGTWLSYYLSKAGKTVLVIDRENPLSPSRISAGVINPVTGRRHATVWMAEELLTHAWQEYTELEKELGLRIIDRPAIIDFFASPQMRLSFLERVAEQNAYLRLPANENHFTGWFTYEFGFGEIQPAYIIHLNRLLSAWRNQLRQERKLLEEDFIPDHFSWTEKEVRYQDHTASTLIFCDGNSSAQRDLFSTLPFAPNKGEMLILRIPGLPAGHIYKKGLTLVPHAEPDHWWVGASYEWEFENANPTAAFRQRTAAQLQAWLQLPFTILDHFAGLRPATLERRPFVGLHPQHPTIGLLNGMGTKGCSLAPFFAKQLADHLLTGTPISPEADISRFKRLLSR